MLPTFLIAGVAKAGTTSLYNYLAKHPNICMSPIKEPNYFRNQPDGPRTVEKTQSHPQQAPRDLEWYKSLFAHCEPENARGEASGYFHRPEAPALIKRTIPDARLIFILRNPVERAFSHYWQAIKNGESLPPFDEAVRNEHPTIRRLLHISAYAEHLEAFYNEFRSEQILLLLFDDLVQSPHSVVNCAYEHIGVDATLGSIGEYKPHNKASLPRSKVVKGILARGGNVVKPIPMPSFLEGPLYRMATGLKARNSQSLGDVRMKDRTRNYLSKQFTHDIRYVEQCLDRNLSHWY